MSGGRTQTYTLNQAETLAMCVRLVREEMQFCVMPHREPGYWQVSYVTRSTTQEVPPNVPATG